MVLQMADGRAAFWQWDTNQRLTLEKPCQVHFANGMNPVALAVESFEENGQHFVNVPNVLLTMAGQLLAYACLQSGEAQFTTVCKRFPIQPRPKPSGYVYTETELRTWESVSREAVMLVQGEADEMKQRMLAWQERFTPPDCLTNEEMEAMLT